MIKENQDHALPSQISTQTERGLQHEEGVPCITPRLAPGQLTLATSLHLLD